MTPNECTLRSIELMAALAQLHADDEVLLAGLLVPLLEGELIDATRAESLFGVPAYRLARELARIDQSGIPAGWNPGEHLGPEQAEGLRKLLLVARLRRAAGPDAARPAARPVARDEIGDARRVAPRRARDARNLRAAREPPRHLAAQVGTGGPGIPLSARRTTTSASPRLLRVEARRARALHRGRQPRTAGRELDAAGIAGEIDGPAEAHLQHLAQDAAQAL